TGSATMAMPWDDAWRDSELRVAAMDTAGVDIQLLSVNPAMLGYELERSAAASFAAGVNDEIAAFTPSSRFWGLAHLPLQDPTAAAAELQRAVSDLGMVGAAIGTNVAGVDLDSADLYPVFEAAAALDVMIFVHPAADRFPRLGYPHYLQNLIGHP